MNNEKSKPTTECCNYEFEETNHPVSWDALNKVIQCRNCGATFRPEIKETKTSNISEYFNNLHTMIDQITNN